MVLLYHDDDGLQDDIGIMIVVRDHLQWRARYRAVLLALQAIAARLGGGPIDLERVGPSHPTISRPSSLRNSFWRT